MHPRKARRNQGRETAANAAVTRSRQRRDVIFTQPPVRATKWRVPTAPGRRPPQFVRSFSSSWSANKPQCLGWHETVQSVPLPPWREACLPCTLARFASIKRRRDELPQNLLLRAPAGASLYTCKPQRRG